MPCGCSGGCQCSIISSGGTISVAGTGEAGNPYDLNVVAAQRASILPAPEGTYYNQAVGSPVALPVAGTQALVVTQTVTVPTPGQPYIVSYNADVAFEWAAGVGTDPTNLLLIVEIFDVTGAANLAVSTPQGDRWPFRGVAQNAFDAHQVSINGVREVTPTGPTMEVRLFARADASGDMAADRRAFSTIVWER